MNGGEKHGGCVWFGVWVLFFGNDWKEKQGQQLKIEVIDQKEIEKK